VRERTYKVKFFLDNNTTVEEELKIISTFDNEEHMRNACVYTARNHEDCKCIYPNKIKKLKIREVANG